MGAQPAQQPPTATAEGPPRFRGAVEAGFEALSADTPGGAFDLFTALTPLVGFSAGDEFDVEVGATLRSRLVDQAPAQRQDDLGGVLRRADWDERSDFGQLLRSLRVGLDGSELTLRGGPADSFSLGRAHLVHRYSNQANPDYHPASAAAQLQLGPTRTELFLSDVLGARVYAGELALDLGRALSAGALADDRYHLAVSAAHDAGQAGGVATPVTLLHLDLDAAVYRGAAAQWFGFVGAGARPHAGGLDAGFLVGVSVEGAPFGARLGGRLEGRKQGGHFRQGFFGPAYELSRFSSTGLRETAAADERLPDGFSGMVELALSAGPDLPGPGAASLFSATVSAEQFSWGRTDVDLRLALRAGARATLAAQAGAVGIGAAPRGWVSVEARYRVGAALYVLAQGGTVYFPQFDGSLLGGWSAGIGAGLDFEG